MRLDCMEMRQIVSSGDLNEFVKIGLTTAIEVSM